MRRSSNRSKIWFRIRGLGSVLPVQKDKMWQSYNLNAHIFLQSKLWSRVDSILMLPFVSMVKRFKWKMASVQQQEEADIAARRTPWSFPKQDFWLFCSWSHVCRRALRRWMNPCCTCHDLFNVCTIDTIKLYIVPGMGWVQIRLL